MPVRILAMYDQTRHVIFEKRKKIKSFEIIALKWGVELPKAPRSLDKTKTMPEWKVTLAVADWWFRIETIKQRSKYPWGLLYTDRCFFGGRVQDFAGCNICKYFAGFFWEKRVRQLKHGKISCLKRVGKMWFFSGVAFSPQGPKQSSTLKAGWPSKMGKGFNWSSGMESTKLRSWRGLWLCWGGE